MSRSKRESHNASLHAVLAARYFASVFGQLYTPKASTCIILLHHRFPIVHVSGIVRIYDPTMFAFYTHSMLSHDSCAFYASLSCIFQRARPISLLSSAARTFLYESMLFGTPVLSAVQVSHELGNVHTSMTTFIPRSSFIFRTVGFCVFAHIYIGLMYIHTCMHAYVHVYIYHCH